MHNFAHQGVSGPHLLHAAGLHRPDYFGHPERMGSDLDQHAINLTKGAILYANFVTTVSPHHAWEVRHTDLGCGLGHTLHRHRDKFGGILNGLDYEMWNPEIDPHIAHHYNAASIGGKALNTLALRERMRLRSGARPIVGYVGRLDTQKGLHLIRHALFHALENEAQFVLLGSGSEHGINEDFWHIKRKLEANPDCHLEIGYDEELAHLIYAGADILVMPSLFEPCGLTQMIALRYGTVPVVRAVGGLKDTVFDWDYSDLPRPRRNGFVFEHPDHAGIESALNRALGLWHDEPALFRQLAEQGMACDCSWNLPCQHYLDIYDFIRHK
jgi:starch synthase